MCVYSKRTLLVRIGTGRCGAKGRFKLCCKIGFGAARGLILIFLKVIALLLL